MSKPNLLDRLAKNAGTRTAVTTDTKAPAKVVTRKGNTTSKRGPDGRFLPAKGKKAAAKRATRKASKKAAAKVTKGATVGLPRKAWNATFSAKIRLAGKNAAGESYYSLAVQDRETWAEVAAAREAGLTPDQVVEIVLANA